MALLSTYQKFKEKNAQGNQGGQSEPQKQQTQKENSGSGLMSTYQQFMSKKQGWTQAVSPAQDYNQRVWDVLQRVDSANASRNGAWSADVTGGNSLEINALLREYDAYEGDKSGMTDYRNMLLGYNKQMQELNGYYSKFQDSDDYDRQRSGYGNFGVGYSAGSWGLSDSEARDIRKQQSQKDAQESQRALAEYTAAKKEFERVDSEWQTMDDRYRSFTIDEYDKDLTEKWQAAKKRMTDAENSLLGARNRMDAYNATWGKIDQYAGDAAAAKGTDTSYTGPGYESIADWENKKNEELAAQDAQAQRADYVPGTLRYTSDTEPVAEDRLGLWRSLTPEQKQDAISSSNVQLNNIVMAGNDGYWDLLTDNEVETYYYIKGQQGQEAANQYLDDMYIELSRRNELKTVQSIENANGWEKAGLTAVSVGANLVGAIPAALGKTADMVTGRTNPYSSMQFFQRYASYIRGSVGQDIGDWTESKLADKFGEQFAAKAGNLANQTFQALMSGVDSWVGGMTFGRGLALPAGPFDFHVGGYTTVMGLGAFAQRAQEMELKGATPTQIAIGSIGSGVLEALFEDLSMEAFFTNILDNPAKTAGEFVKKLAIQMGVEGSEEMFTEMGNIILDAINMGKNSDNSMAAREYMRQGMTEEEAKRQVWKDNAVEILWAGYGGAISAGTMAAGGQLATDTVRKASNTIGNYSVGDTLTKNGRYVDLQEQANALQNQKKGAKLAKAAQEVAQKASAGDKSIGNKYRMGKVATQIAQQAGREASRAEVTEFRAAAEKYLAGQRDIQNKKHALNVLTRAYEGTTMVPGDRAYMRMIQGDKLTQNILDSIGGKETLQENAKAREAASMRTAASVQGSVLGIEPTQERAAYDSDNSGQAYLKDSKDPVNIRGIAEIKDGQMYVATDEGQTVKASDVSFGSYGEAALYSAIGNMHTDTQKARSLLYGLDSSGMSTQAYATALQNAYNKGMSGVSYEGIQSYSSAAKLSDDMRRQAWEAGRDRRAVKTGERAAKVDSGTLVNREKGLTIQDSAKSIQNLNEQQKAGVAAAKVLAEAGLHIEVYASTESERQNGAPNGIYRGSDGTIHIDLNAGDNGQGTVAYALAHETTHFIKDLSPAKYQIYADILIEAAESKGISYDSLLARQLAKQAALEENRGKSAEELQKLAYDETIAEMSETMLTDTDAAQRVSQELYKKDRTLWEKIKDFFTGLVEKLKNAYKGVDPDSDMGRVMKRAIQDNEAVAQAWAEAVVEAGENYQLQDGTVIGTDGNSADYLYSNRVTDKKTLDFLDGQETVTTYKTMQLVDGKLYPPMAAVVAGSYEDYSELGKWEAATEHPELIKLDKSGKPKFTLNKGKGQGSLAAAYNPYMHSSNLVLNDQFSGAYTRPNLVTVECRVPVSELTSGYKAQYAKDSVGWHSWHTGTVAGALRQQTGTERQVLLSRWIMPVRIVPNAEVAQMYKQLLDGTDIAVPDNVVPPALLTELKKAGVAISESGRIQDGQKNNARAGERYSPRMTSDMTEQERYDKLKDLSLTVTASVNQNAISEAEAKYGTDIRDGVRLKSNDRKKLFQKIASIFGVMRDYRNQDIELEFGFSNENLSESLNKQKRYYYSYLKMLSCFENVVDSAIGIETHNRNEAGYKVDPTLKNMYVLVSAFQDGENITPVKLEIKEFSDKPNTLYVAIALDSIQSDKIGNKKSGIATEGNTVSGVTQSAPPLTISLADLFANVNPQDSSFLKYVPTQFLTEQQRAGEKYSSRTGDNIGGLQAELYQLKEQRKKLLEADPAYRAAQEQQRYANSFSERVSASKALKAAASNIDTSAIDSRITELQDRITEIRESKVRQHREEQEKYSGTKTGGYSLEPDTRLKDLDADYSEAVKSGNRRKMQALVDRAAEAAMPKSVVRDESGKLLKVYHYTNNDFTVFDRGMARTGNEMDGFFFAPDTESTREYGKRRIAAYLNITNLALDPVLDREFNDSGTLLREKLAAQGYDGVARTENGKIYEYMVFDSNQVKYADAVTYDDNGDVIPLSQRFDTANEDIRYSTRNNQESQVDRLARKNEELKAEAEYLRQVVQIQKRGNSRNLLDRESVSDIAKSILKSVNARDTEFGKKLNDFYRDMVTVEMDYDTMQEKAGELADRALEHHQAERDGYAQEVLDFLKKRRVSLTESQIGDAEYTYGSLSEFKKAIKGSIIIDQNSTTSLDQLWQEAAAQFPDQFSADITEADMPDGIANIVSWATNAEADSETEFQYYKAETRADLTQKILMGFLDAKPIESISETLKQQMADLKKQHQQEMRELRKSWDEEAKAMEQSHKYDLEAERKRGKAAVEALKYQQEVIQKAQKGLWETERADIKRSYEKQMKELREQNTQKAHEKVESRHRTEERHKLQNTVDTLNRMLLRPTNTSHVPQELQSSVAMAMKVINGVILDSKAGQNADRLAKYAEQMRVLEKNPEANAEKIAVLNKKIGNLTGRDISMKAALTSLQEQYAKLEGQDGGLYDSNIEALIEDAKETIGNTAYKDLSLKQLKAVRDTYTALLTTIRNANKAFVAGKNARIDEMVQRATTELSLMKKKNPNQTAIGRNIDQFFWNNEKPVYAFERIGSAVMSELYDNLRKGEDTFYRDVSEARKFFLESAEKNGFNKWDLNELKEFTAANGQKFQLSLDELMSLYAYSLRPQAREHLTKGGIVLGENTKRFTKGPLGVTRETTYNDANAYTLTDETIDAISESLTKEQRQFAFEMQQYLAKIMGAKGDEVNMALYGIKKFGEETYWPLKSSGVFSERIREQQERTGNKQKNKGFTKALTQHANNAIELSSLTETWAEHVNDMSMYHAFTLPMEDFYRVYNWTQKGDTDGKRTMGVRQMIQQTAGKGAVTYIDQFLKDLNGGLRADPRETVSKAMLSGFKKAAVSASLSVAIQQPSAVGRALAYIEANYFVGGKVESAGGVKETWAQLKKYAAVAGLKEMGRFDVDMGQSTLEYIIGRNSVNAWGKFTDKVDELSGWLPEMADQVTWCAIWEAAKRKTAAQNPGLRGEALLQKAGELFTDTITRTQVYDSVFSRSANMRAKSGLMSMATAFMAEPTTTANMVEDAVRKFAKGDKRMAGKMLSSVAVATVLNAALAAVVYAARDDDKTKTYWEKYLASLAGETVDSFNPLTYIPVLADINNLLLGYSIERTDMSLASDLITALKKITTLYGKYDDEWSDEEKKEWEKKIADAWKDNALMAGTIMGLPLKNLARDVEAIINTATNPSNGAEMSADTILKGMKDSARKSLPILSWKADESNSDQLYKAIIQGKDVLAKRLKAQYGDDKKYESALLKGLRENDPRIKEAAQYAIDGKTPERVAVIRKIVAEGHFTQDQVIKAINQKANSMKQSTSSDKDPTPQKLYDYDEYVNAAANGLGYAGDVQKELIRYQADRNQEKDEKLSRSEAEEDAAKTFKSRVKSETKDSYAAGELTEEQARKVLTEADIAKDEELDDLILQWDTELELGSEISWSNARYLDYAEAIQPAGISAEDYDNYIRATSKMNGIDENGDGKKEITKQAQVIEYIDSMPISDEQKDILFQAEYPNARKSVLRKLPWR